MQTPLYSQHTSHSFVTLPTSILSKLLVLLKLVFFVQTILLHLLAHSFLTADYLFFLLLSYSGQLALYEIFLYDYHSKTLFLLAGLRRLEFLIGGTNCRVFLLLRLNRFKSTLLSSFLLRSLKRFGFLSG